MRMSKDALLLRLDQLSSSYLVLLALVVVGLLAGLLLHLGVIGWGLRLFGTIVSESIRLGFRLWEKVFSWATWDIFLMVVVGCVFCGWLVSGLSPLLTLLFSLVPILMGVTACLTYMAIDQERYEVARGYKAVHNPLKGQVLAWQLVRYGQQVGMPLLVSASIGVIGGFALLNFGLYQSIGRNWYSVAVDQPAATFVDFLANALIVLLRIVDVLDFATNNHILGVSYVRQSKWPSTTLLNVFKMFFTLVLLQKLFASIRQGSLLSETISDLWNPHGPIHERARHALPQYGPSAVGPLLVSLGSITNLTKEQREQLPPILAAIGPGAIPTLVRHLTDSPPHVRAIAISTLGHLHARDSLPMIAQLSQDPSDLVRWSVVDALGILGVPEETTELAIKLPVLDEAPPTRRKFWRFSLFEWKRRRKLIIASDPVKLAVKTLQAALMDELPAIRTEAARGLGRIGRLAAASAFPLIGILSDEHESVRLEATKALGRVGGPKTATMTALIESLEDVSPQVRAAAARALGLLGEAAQASVPALVALLQDRDEAVRTAVAEAIGEIGTLDGDAADELILGLASPDNIVRAQTAEALGNIGEPAQETAAALVDAVSDRNDMVRAKAVEALGKIGEAAAEIAVPSLVKALRDRDNSVSSLAAEALGQMGEWADGAIPDLIRALNHINPQVRACAAEALGKMGLKAGECRPALELACRDDDADVRCRALWALGQSGPPTTVTRQAVLAGLQDPDGIVRAAAVAALGKWNDSAPPIIARVLELMEDPDDLVKIQVTQVLPQLAGPLPEVIEALCECLRADGSDEVQVHAARALGELGPAAQAAGETLLKASLTGDVHVREQAIRAIAQILPPECLPALVTGLKDPNSEIRKVASEGLTKVHEITPDTVPELIEALNDPEIQVRANAAQALALLPTLPALAIPLLQACASDPDENLRLKASLALKLITEPTTTTST